MKDEGKCIPIGLVHCQTYLDASSIRRAARKFHIVECCHWKELAEFRSHQWRVDSCLISTTVTNDIPFGSIIIDSFACRLTE